MSNKHKHAELIHKWADGAQIQYHQSGWFDVTKPQWNNDTLYRVKPKPLVKKYLIVYKYETGQVIVTNLHYVSAQDFLDLHSYAKIVWASLVKESMIEVEE